MATDFYTKYSSYPPYCSTPEQRTTRSIPPLNTNTTDAKLLHVTAVLRHGARTPWGNALNCWEDYWTNPSTGIWNCNLTAYLAPPPPIRAEQEGTRGSSSEEEAMFLFEKRYDASSAKNLLNGTCQLGQLILQGYSQELQNGQFLRDAYVFNKEDSNPPSFMNLIDAEQYPLQDIYYRVDDDERTLMSGQIVLRGLLGSELHQFYQEYGYYPVLPLHTADREVDILDANYILCPRLAEIKVDPLNAIPDLYALNNGQEAITLKKFQRDVLKIPRPEEDMHAIDCLMTTICTDRPLPKAVDDYGADGSEGSTEYGSNLFQRLIDYATQQYTIPLKANDAEFARIAMGPLWYEILGQMEPHLKGNHGGPKLAVFSGHDTTIMPLLASLDPQLWPDNDWPPYASMIVIELYQVDSGTAFRLIYNGKVRTDQMKGCDQELCDTKVLLDRVQSFARKDLDPVQCQATTIPNTPVNDLTLAGIHLDPKKQTQDILSTPEGTAYLVLIVLGSVLVGALLACFTCCICGGGSVDVWRCRRRQTSRPVAAQDEVEEYADDPML